MKPDTSEHVVSRKLDIEQLIAEVVARLAPQLRTEASAMREHGELRIVLRDRYVYCDGRSLDLSRRPMVWRLFDLFYRAPAHTLTRSELAFAVYGVPNLEAHSERYRAAVHGNLVKLISRARTLACAQFGGEYDAGIDWFAYDHSTRTWAFYRLGPIRGRHLAVSEADPRITLPNPTPEKVQPCARAEMDG